jgi:poly(3-hydroxybutyrate) depolymerase
MPTSVSRLLAVVFLGAMPALCMAAPATEKATVLLPQLQVRVHTEPGGKTLPYRLLVPKDYVEGEHRPLVVWLHGSGEKGSDNNKQVKFLDTTFLGGKLGTKFPAFVMIPQCPSDGAWVATGFNKGPAIPEPVRMVAATIQELVKEFQIDDRRIYVGGFSMGGLGTWEMLKRYPDLFAAGFPVAGGPVERPGMAAWVKNIPVWIFQGDQDRNVPVEWSRKIVAQLKAVGGKVKYTEYAGLGHEPARALAEPELPVWLLQQKRDKPASFVEAKLPDDVASIIKTLPDSQHGTWKGKTQRTPRGEARIIIDETYYRVRPAEKAEAAVEEMIAKIGKGEAAGPCEITATVVLEGNRAWLEAEKIVVTK